jgi:hypothetical protein
MSSKHDEPNETNEHEARKHYERPKVLESAKFETLAAGCGLADSSGGLACITGPNLS